MPILISRLTRQQLDHFATERGLCGGRLYIPFPKNLVRCDRNLFEKLKALDANQLAEKTKHYLSKDEVKGVMARRDKIVAYFQKLISEKGENEVLFRSL